MKKVLKDNCVTFYNDNDKELMYMDHSIDECIWFFYTDDVISVTEDMELYPLLRDLMSQRYDFMDDVLQDCKEDNKLVWHSDCYYNPDDKFSMMSVSCLNIEYVDNTFKIWCERPLDKVFDRKDKSYCIAFSPAGNGKKNRNTLTGSTLQTDFVMLVYRKLIDVKRLIKK